MAYYESELAEAMLNAIADGHSTADAKNDIKTFQEAVNLLPKYNTPELMVFLMRKVISEARKHHNIHDIMRESFADWDNQILETIKP